MTAAGDDGEAARRRKLAELGPCKDWNDFLQAAVAAGWTQDEIDAEFRRAMEEAPEPAPDEGNVVRLDVIRSTGENAPEPEPDDVASASSATVIDPKAPLRTARLLVGRGHTQGGARILHHWRDTFYRWNGSCYEQLGEQVVRNLVYAALSECLRVAGNRLARIEPTPRLVSDVIDSLKPVCALDDRIEPKTWLGPAPAEDRPPASEFVAVRNGLVHLPSRELWAPDPSFFVLSAAAIDFDPEAPAPAEWAAFLRSLWAYDQASIDTLQELVGYWLSGETVQQKIALLVGPTRSGKSTIGRIVTQLLGPANVTAPALGDFGNRFGLEPLVGKSLAIVADARLSDRTDQAAIVEKMLSISGEDTVTIDRKYREPWGGRLGTRLLLISNEAPILRDTSCALQNRFIVLKLTQDFLNREDTGLGERLSAELAGIFNWAVEGWHRLRARGRFLQPESAAEMIRAMADLASPVSAFLRDRCVRSAELQTEQKRLYEAFGQWHADQGRDGRKITKNRFTRELSTVGVSAGQSRIHEDLALDRVWVYRGVGLRSP